MTARSRTGVTLASLGLLALVAGACSSTPAAKGHPQPPPHHKTTKPKPGAAKDVTFQGTYGREASWVVAENRRPGTTAWRITKGASPDINGFANKTYTSDGTKVVLYVSTPAPSFRVEAFRMGYYQGKGARLVWQSNEIPSHVKAPCTLTPGVNMVSCDRWAPTLTVKITSSFVQGDYLFKLVGSGGHRATSRSRSGTRHRAPHIW